MKASVGQWLLVVCCSVAAAAAVEDNVLRFLSHKDVVRMRQEDSQRQNPKEQSPTSDVNFIMCGDGKSECPDGTTCCKQATGGYGCCPYPKAACCKDGKHCCPSHYTCDVAQQSCKKGNILVPFGQKFPAIQREGSVMCPDKESQCPDGDTCCQLPDKTFGCCPLPDAVCCSDGEHCCPQGYKCDLQKQTCDQNQISIPMVKKRPKTPNSVQDVVCPGGTSECPDGSTCCKMSSGEYGCCPLPNAVCCSDGLHCCPSGMTCDVSQGKCDSALHSLPWVEKVPAVPRVQNVVCPDQRSECPDGSTCCKLSSGVYGCCPLPKAVCCSDGVHCCPSGMTCDVSQGKCNSALHSVPWVEKLPAVRNGVQNVPCPDQSQCPDGNTCCKLKNGQYGCCPLPDAVCCSDGVHCCPSGMTCDVSQGKCNSALHSVPWVEKLPAVRNGVQNVVCPDKQSQCPDGNTCCQLSSGQYGCCPLPNAVCCADHVHCCPSGYTCDTGSGRCRKGQYSVALIKKVPAL